MTPGLLIDIHTHRPDAEAPAVISVELGMPRDPDRRYSVGIHPWATSDPLAIDLDALAAAAAAPEVVAIGETGIDKLRGGPLRLQLEILRRHIELSESLGKPLILHAVKAFPELIALRREYRPRERWIVHGFRGKPQLARELLSHGFDLSLGERFNHATAAIVPADRLWIETDTSPLPIAAIAARVAAARKLAVSD